MKLDIIGDVHGCYDEFVQLTKKLGYQWNEGYPNHYDHRQLAFIGDITDRGPNSIAMIEIVFFLVVKKNKHITYQEIIVINYIVTSLVEMYEFPMDLKQL